VGQRTWAARQGHGATMLFWTILDGLMRGPTPSSICFADGEPPGADPSGAAGGGGGGGGDPGPAKTFSQTEVNAIVEKRLAQERKKFASASMGTRPASSCGVCSRRPWARGLAAAATMPCGSFDWPLQARMWPSCSRSTYGKPGPGVASPSAVARRSPNSECGPNR